MHELEDEEEQLIDGLRTHFDKCGNHTYYME